MGHFDDHASHITAPTARVADSVSIVKAKRTANVHRVVGGHVTLKLCNKCIPCKAAIGPGDPILPFDDMPCSFCHQCLFLCTKGRGRLVMSGFRADVETASGDSTMAQCFKAECERYHALTKAESLVVVRFSICTQGKGGLLFLVHYGLRGKNGRGIRNERATMEGSGYLGRQEIHQ